jgi:hypothetical protein
VCTPSYPTPHKRALAGLQTLHHMQDDGGERVVYIFLSRFEDAERVAAALHSNPLLEGYPLRARAFARRAEEVGPRPPPPPSPRHFL